jgi:hypothetical protein
LSEPQAAQQGAAPDGRAIFDQRPRVSAQRWPAFLCGRSVVATWWLEEPILSGNSNPSDGELERLQPSAFSVILHLLICPNELCDVTQTVARRLDGE